jgi:hypothetical protein
LDKTFGDMDRPIILEGDETPSDGMPEAHKSFACMGLDEPDDEVFEEDDFDPSKSFHSRYDHRQLHPIELKVRKEVNDTGYRGYTAPTPHPVPLSSDFPSEEILHKVSNPAYSTRTCAIQHAGQQHLLMIFLLWTRV